ncbi:MAG: hypothetical protein JNN04_02980 [Cyclobacteriaceae bacterium]|nr:hypothetical protein [Cyclobacteriaceae bacterium]
MDKEKLPYATIEYIAKRFRKEFLFELKERKKEKGHWVYVVEVTQDDFVHTLHFDEKGVLLKEEADPAFPADAHDGPAPEVVPD